MAFFRYIPNSITCMNLACGCLSITLSFSGQSQYAVYCIFAAAIFDFLDGFAARGLHAYSAIGKELDSLADVISFGLAPAVMLFTLLQSAWSLILPSESVYTPGTCGWWLSLPAFFVAIFSALRLAIFNLDERQTTSFIGLPTPANALFICALTLSAAQDGLLSSWVDSIYFLLPVTVLSSYLLVSNIPMFSLKFKTFSIKDNLLVYCFLGISLILLILLHFEGFAFVIGLYIILSCFKAVSSRQ